MNIYYFRKTFIYNTIRFKIGRMYLARISIIGSGVVGSIVGMGFRELGNDVVFYDIDEKKMEALREKGIDSTTNINKAIHNSDISFVAVPTPSKDGKIDLTFVKTVIGDIANVLKNKDTYHTIVIKSTVVPTTTEKVVKPIIETLSGKKCGEDFGLCMNPEFLTEVNNTWTDDTSMTRGFFSEERIVIGEFDKKAGDIVEELYKPLNVPIFRTNTKVAELIKYASNSALATRISYWNEIYYICEGLGIDSDFVARIVGMDKRIGKYGTIHKKAFGGKCLPKDLQAIIAFSKQIGHEPILLNAVHEVNERIKEEKGGRE